MRALVVFDWNGTVVDDVERAADAMAEVLRARGIDPPDAAGFRAAFRLPLAALFGDLGVIADTSAAEAEWNALMARRETALSAGVEEALVALAADGHRLGVVSAASTVAIRQDAERLGIVDRFEFMHGGRADKTAALRDLAAPRLAYVGDTEYDMASAVAAGATAIGYGAGYRPASALRAGGADRVIDHMRELAQVVESLLRPVG